MRLSCDHCLRIIYPGEEYAEVLEAARTAGDPPPKYAAKFNYCTECDEERDELYEEWIGNDCV